MVVRTEVAVAVIVRCEVAWRLTLSASPSTALAGTVLLPLQWWPEWRISTADHDLPYRNLWGLVAVSLPAGTFEIRASLAPSRSRAVGAVLSWCGLAGLFLFVALRNRARARAAASAEAR